MTAATALDSDRIKLEYQQVCRLLDAIIMPEGVVDLDGEPQRLVVPAGVRCPECGGDETHIVPEEQVVEWYGADAIRELGVLAICDGCSRAFQVAANAAPIGGG